jgi:1-acyl-sn-glycerol-3-phosphate acyltransferase
VTDRDGIERPDKPDAHVNVAPHVGTKKITEKKHIIRKNPVLIFFGYLLRIVVWAVFTPVFFFKFRLKVRGKKRLRALKKQGLVLVCNHCHVLDVVAYAIKFMPRIVWITSLAENFQIPVAGTIIKTCAAVPIPYDLKGMRLFKEVIDGLLQEKKAVGFLPEGSMWPYYRSLRPFKSGAFRFAVQNDVAVLPAAISASIVHKSLKKKKYRFTITYLEPLYRDKALSEAAAVEDLKNRTHEAMRLTIEAGSEGDVYSKRYKRQ